MQPKFNVKLNDPGVTTAEPTVNAKFMDPGEFEALDTVYEKLQALTATVISTQARSEILETQLRAAKLEIAAPHSQVKAINDTNLVKTSGTQRYIEAPLLEDQAGNQYWQCQLNEIEDSLTASQL